MFELCWSRVPHRREIARIMWSGTLGMPGEDTPERIHATQKPTALWRWLFERHRHKQVLDLFAGSGTTIVACEKTPDRVAYACELVPRIADTICHRFQAYAGTVPIRDGEAVDYLAEGDDDPPPE